jgi:hypothetical protein
MLLPTSLRNEYQRRSTMLTSQVPISRWHEQIGDPTLSTSGALCCFPDYSRQVGFALTSRTAAVSTSIHDGSRVNNGSACKLLQQSLNFQRPAAMQDVLTLVASKKPYRL